MRTRHKPSSLTLDKILRHRYVSFQSKTCYDADLSELTLSFLLQSVPSLVPPSNKCNVSILSLDSPVIYNNKSTSQSMITLSGDGRNENTSGENSTNSVSSIYNKSLLILIMINMFILQQRIPHHAMYQSGIVW